MGQMFIVCHRHVSVAWRCDLSHTILWANNKDVSCIRVSNNGGSTLFLHGGFSFLTVACGSISKITKFALTCIRSIGIHTISIYIALMLSSCAFIDVSASKSIATKSTFTCAVVRVITWVTKCIGAAWLWLTF